MPNFFLLKLRIAIIHNNKQSFVCCFWSGFLSLFFVFFMVHMFVILYCIQELTSSEKEAKDEPPFDQAAKPIALTA